MSENSMESNKMLHVVYRVGNMDRAINFYKEVFDMKLLRFRDIPEEKYSNAFLGYGTESEGKHFSIELTYNYGIDSYKLGDGFQGMGLSMTNLRGIAKKVQDFGGQVSFGPDDVEYGPCMIPDEPVGKKTIATLLKVRDLDGYEFEVIEKNRRDPVSKVRLSVSNIDASIEFYQKVLGMTLFYKRSNVPYEASMSCGLGYKSMEDSCFLELTYYYASEALNMGDAYGQIAISTPDVYKAAELIEKAGSQVSRAPGPVSGIGTKITAVRDPDNYKIVLVDEADFEKELE